MARPSDPLGVLATTRLVVEQAKLVQLDHDVVEQVASDLVDREAVAPDWHGTLHWHGERERMANYLLVLDALNFCFWGEPRWRVRYQGQTLDGYWALAASLTRALDEGLRLDDPRVLARLSREELAEVFAGDGEIPLLDARLHNLHEVGSVLLERFDGRFARAIEEVGGSAMHLVELVAESFPSFRDVSDYQGREVRFYKRAQILISDLYGAFGGQELGHFDDLADLTAFADYKVPQVLRRLGILRYAPGLTARLAAFDEIPAGSPIEIEIRAATIWGVEELRRALARRGRWLAAFEIDWLLWDAGQRLPSGTLPYHRTRTIAY